MTLCDTCQIRKGCDWLSEMCQLRPGEVAILRPDLIHSDTDPECAFVQINGRTGYQRFYQAHRRNEIDRVMQWQRENKDKLAAAQKRYQSTPEYKARRNERRRNAKAIYR